MFKSIWENLKGLYSLLVGLKVTGKVFITPIETVFYPREVVDPEIIASYRGPLKLVGEDDNPAVTKCISCMMCVKACPSSCLTVEKSSKDKSKLPSTWIYDFSLCSLCGSCVGVCPKDALKFSHEIYMVSYTREDLKLDLLKRLKDKASLKLAKMIKEEELITKKMDYIDNKSGKLKEGEELS